MHVDLSRCNSMLKDCKSNEKSKSRLVNFSKIASMPGFNICILMSDLSLKDNNSKNLPIKEVSMREEKTKMKREVTINHLDLLCSM